MSIPATISDLLIFAKRWGLDREVKTGDGGFAMRNATSYTSGRLLSQQASACLFFALIFAHE
jgi:hypothetical protein